MCGDRFACGDFAAASFEGAAPRIHIDDTDNCIEKSGIEKTGFGDTFSL